MVEAAGSVSVGLLLWYGGGEVLHGVIGIGTLVAFKEYLHRFFVPLRDFSQKYAVMQSAMASAERIFQLLDTPMDIHKPAKCPSVPKPFRGEVVFDNVWFDYKADDPVLKGVSFRIEPGERIAVVGATGSGKTTTIKLLNRLLRYSKRLDQSRRRRRARVGFARAAATYRRGLAGRVSVFRRRARQSRAGRSLDADGTNRRGGSGCQRRQLHSPAARRLSRRRCASAAATFPAASASCCRWRACWFTSRRFSSWTRRLRASIPRPKRLIQDALEKVMRDRTCLLIAHRLSTIRNADRIIVLHHGEVREVGSHAELMEKQGIYYRLYQLQYEREELKLAAQ